MWSNENAASEEHFRTRAKSGILLDALNDCSLTGGFDHSFLHLFSCCLQSYPVWKCGVWFTSTKEGQLHSEGRNGQSLSSSLCLDLEWFWSSCSGEDVPSDWQQGHTIDPRERESWPSAVRFHCDRVGDEFSPGLCGTGVSLCQPFHQPYLRTFWAIWQLL